MLECIQIFFIIQFIINDLEIFYMFESKIPVDLHTHSKHSDGYYSVEDLLKKAKLNGCKYLALTDHDTCKGIEEARVIAKNLDIKFISGVEISVTWNQYLLHIVGLNIDENNKKLNDHLCDLQKNRIIRAQEISAKLAAGCIEGALEGAMRYCDKIENISRTHFARFLVDTKRAEDREEAFLKYLAEGKIGYAPMTWGSLSKTVELIKEAGGVAVIAHPGRYKMSRPKLYQMIHEFQCSGGEAIEVVSSSHTLKMQHSIAKICREKKLLASMGSDFHTDTDRWNPKVGINNSLPDGVLSIFDRLQIIL
jgi:predicted metal-dependent phosphoesterase TrpH